MDVQVLVPVRQAFQQNAGGLSLKGTPAPTVSAKNDTGTLPSSFSLQQLASIMRGLKIQPDSLQIVTGGETMGFSFTQSGQNAPVQTSGTLNLKTQNGTVSVSYDGLNFTLKMAGASSQPMVQQVPEQVQALEKMARNILQEIQQVMRANPGADINQVAVSVVTHYLQPLGRVMRYVMNFFFQMGSQQGTSPAPSAAVQPAVSLAVAGVSSEAAPANP